MARSLVFMVELTTTAAAPSSPAITSTTCCSFKLTTGPSSPPVMRSSRLWETILTRVTSSGPHIPMDPRDLDRCPMPLDAWVIYSLLLLLLEAFRPYLRPLLIAAPLIFDDGRMYTLPFCALLLFILSYTQNRYEIDPETTPGVRGGEEGSDFTKVVKATLEERVKANRPTPFLLNGHCATAFPFLTVKLKPLKLLRRWIMTDDGKTAQSIALDWQLPPRDVKGILLVLHGLNGGSKARYVQDLYWRAVQEGYAVCCMINRGACGTPVEGGPENEFSVGRISDVYRTIEVLHDAIGSSLPLTLVGYSMGGIVASNVVAKYGHKLKGKLSGCVSVSGCIRMYDKVDYPVAREVWQPIMTFELKQCQLGPLIRRSGFVPSNPDWYRKPMDLVDVDADIMAPLHGFDDPQDYRHWLSAASEQTSEGARNIAIPTLLVHACDDPVIHVDAAAKLPPNHSKYLYTLVTPTGGHLGWPQGWAPWQEGFRWISDTVMAFSDVVSSNTRLLAKEEEMTKLPHFHTLRE
ncbi:Phospholipase abhd3 [Perkinsus olseni]|uniref:Phospholipase abhd3 n=2 Tax=Perkinsus olseni TaxID=32597 RepID=A0A7J6P352_PEROL|nr:Phospholipase abhd3 [Perkinsus olseni]